MKLNKIIYRPSKISILIDFSFLALCIFVVLRFFPLTTQNPFQKYDLASVIYFAIWFVISYILGRYKALQYQKYVVTSTNLILATLFTFLTMWAISYFVFDKYFSVSVLFIFTFTLLLVNSAFHLLYFAIIYAVNYDEEIIENEHRANAVTKKSTPLDEESYQDLCSVISDFAGEKTLRILEETVDFRSGNTLVSFLESHTDLQSKIKYKFSTIVLLQLLNDIRGINKMFSIINNKLPDNGILITRFESKSTIKKRFLKKYPAGLNMIFYSVYFFIKRVIPQIFLTKRIYYDITKGRNRVLSKTEVLGRLYLFGFEVFDEKKIGEYNYIYARRVKQPDTKINRIYGPLIKLSRVGKNGKKFNVYKFRTMHPYSEFIQAYIFNKNSLQDGGKFKRDIRITTMGRFMRKYWLDELPMLINLLKNEMKIVGVRPLSAHYFSLYSKELQELRTKTKPGLLPPFYADMPKTLAEIEASELKYIHQCLKRGTLITDIKYLFLILNNILFKKARSA